MTQICIGKLTIIGSENGFLPGRHQAIIWTNDGILLIALVANFSEILVELHIVPSKKMHLKMSFAKRGPFCLGLNVLTFIVDAFYVTSGYISWVDNILVWAQLFESELLTPKRLLFHKVDAIGMMVSTRCPKIRPESLLVFSFAIHSTFLVLKPDYAAKLANTVSLYSSHICVGEVGQYWFK